MFASEEVSQFLEASRKEPAPSSAVPPLSEHQKRLQAILVTADGRGKAVKQSAFEELVTPESDLVNRLQHQKFLLECRVQELRDQINRSESNPQEQEKKINIYLKQLHQLEQKTQKQEKELKELREFKRQFDELAKQLDPGKREKPIPKESPKKEKPVADITIEADAGTSCNNPKIGYGKGYGSFQINAHPIVRLKFGRMSANAAEITIITEALKRIEEKEKSVLVCSDSQIALKWVDKAFKRDALKLSKGSSEAMQAAVLQLYSVIEPFRSVQTHWRGRAHSVKLFGH